MGYESVRNGWTRCAGRSDLCHIVYVGPVSMPVWRGICYGAHGKRWHACGFRISDALFIVDCGGDFSDGDEQIWRRPPSERDRPHSISLHILTARPQAKRARLLRSDLTCGGWIQRGRDRIGPERRCGGRCADGLEAPRGRPPHRRDGHVVLDLYF